MSTREGAHAPAAAAATAAPAAAKGVCVALRNVTKRFDGVTAVDDLTLEVLDNEFLVLLGPSGCGKSTALRIIAGLEEPTAGTVELGGRDVTDVEAKDRDISMVFQSYALYPHMTVRRNIEFPLAARRVDRAERDAAVAEAARALDLEALLDRKPAQLSGGQRQRVALARAIVRKPLAFLMDEPLSNLDAKLRVQTRAELIELHRRLAATVVYVTHDQVEAMTMGDRIAVMSEGVLQQVGPPQDVYERPANLFVARFIGSPPMNTAPGTVRDASGDRDDYATARAEAERLPGTVRDAGDGRDGEALAVEVGGGRLDVPPALAGEVRRRGLRDVVVGVRPEGLVLAGDRTGMPATVALVESLGHERHLLCRLDGGELLTVRLAADAPAPADGAAVRLAVKPGQLHLFDPATTERLG